MSIKNQLRLDYKLTHLLILKKCRYNKKITLRLKIYKHQDGPLWLEQNQTQNYQTELPQIMTRYFKNSTSTTR